MKLVMTLMVRDEADIISAMIKHHFSQGITQAIITDNGSTDGTWTILKRLAKRYPIDLRQDPVHRKQQSEVVTRMAQEASTRYSADWVINADADEFWLSLDRTRTLHQTLSDIQPSLQSFSVPVRDMTGPPALAGTGLQRLVLQDPRTAEELHSVGLLAPSTSDCVHIGTPEVEVAQGNHMVSLASRGSPPIALSLEVLHFPWRSWRQFARKVSNAGNAYRANPELQPSPNHHGMRDFRRYEAGNLLPHYVARCLDPAESDVELRSRAVLDTAIADTLRSPVRDKGLSLREWAVLRELGQVLIALENTEAAIAEGHDIGTHLDERDALVLRERFLRTHCTSRVRRLLRRPLP